MKVIKSYKNLASPLTLPYLVINSHDVTEHVGLVREHLQATYKPVGKFYKSGQPKCNVLVVALTQEKRLARLKITTCVGVFRTLHSLAS